MDLTRRDKTFINLPRVSFFKNINSIFETSFTVDKKTVVFVFNILWFGYTMELILFTPDDIVGIDLWI